MTKLGKRLKESIILGEIHIYTSFCLKALCSLVELLD